MGRLEILSPAGSMEGLKAAINANCDALYIGGSSFGARAYANNLKEEDMLRTIDYAHVHGKSLYLTINTLLKNEELKSSLYEYLHQYYTQGIDAVIVQDLGVLHFVHENFPQLPIHASTQMSLTMAQGANELKRYGVNRLVTARELSLNEIRAIRETTDLEIESFVHGALCFSYSGQCLMSSMIGGRSGNRGRCAQTCRMPYKVKEDNQIISSEEHSYILSPKDMCTINLIPEMVDAGINSFKIEGRMKRPEYAAGVTYVYRKYLDYFLTHGRDKFKDAVQECNQEYQKDMQMLKDLYNRGGFSNGYYEFHNGKKMMSMDRPNHSGICIGKVKNVSGISATIELSEDVNAKDILEFRDADKSLYEFTKKDFSPKGSTIRTNFLKGSGIKPGNLVYRTKNNELIDTLQEKYVLNECKVPIQGYVRAMVGQPLMITLVCGEHHISVEGDVVEPAMNQPTLVEKIEKQMKKTRDTSFEFEHLEITADKLIFVPVGKLNELRRSAIEKLSEAIAVSYRREDRERDFLCALNDKNNKEEANVEKKHSQGIQLTVCIHDLSQLELVCEYPEVDNIYIDMNCIQFDEIEKYTKLATQAGKAVFLVLPHIFRKETNDLFEKYKNDMLQDTIHGYVIRNLEEYSFMNRVLKEEKQEENKELILDYNVYVMNEEAKQFWKEKNITHYTTSLELNFNEMKNLGCQGSDLMVYGRIPLMVSAQCVTKNVGNHCERMQQRITGNLKSEIKDGSKVYELVDRFNKSFYVRNHCKFCYNTIYNGDCLSLLSNRDEVVSLQPKAIRLDFTFEPQAKIRKVIEAYIHGYVLQDINPTTVKKNSNLTRGHFKRGVQ